jgi:hypothetical protein
LWHFDGAATNLDGSTNILVPDEVLTGGIVLTNIGQPTPGVPPYTNTSLGNVSFAGLTNSMQTTDKFAMAYGGLFPTVAPFCDTNTGAFTFEAMVKFNVNPLAPPNQLEIVCGDQPGAIAQRGWQYRINTGGRMEFNLLGGNGADNDLTAALPPSGPNAAVAGQWYHVAVTCTGNSPTNGDTPNVVKFYWTLLDAFRTNADLLATFTMTRSLNGTASLGAGTVQPALGIGGSGRKITTGGNGVANGEGLIGNVDEVRISGIARQSNQMAFVVGGALSGPSFQSQPPSSALIGYGKNLNVPSIVVGTLPVYNQWQRTNSATGGFTNVPGQTQNNLAINGIKFTDADAYRLLSTNAYGRATSIVVQVTVGAAFSDLFNTGINASGLLDTNTSPGGPDAHYRLQQSSDPLLLGPNAIIWNMFGYPMAAFSGNFANYSDTSAWIGPTSNNYASPAGQYIYRTIFVADSIDVTKPAKISGIWYENETGVDILINGHSTGNSFAVADSSNGKFSKPFSVTNGFVAGLNTLDFVVVRGNPPFNGTYQESALRVDMSDSIVQLTAVGVPLPPGTPIITNQPVNQTVRDANSTGPGAVASFSVVALGRPPLNYQWWADNAPLSGATNRTLRFDSPFTGGQGTNFFVIVSNDSGSVTSQVAVLTLLTTNQPPIAPNYNFTVYSNTTLNVSIFTLFANATDADNDILTFTSFDPGSTNGAPITQAGILLTYTPIMDYIGQDQFGYAISDPLSMTSAFINVNVVALQAPALSHISRSGNSIVLSGSGGAAGGGYHVLSSTDLTIPVANWTPAGTGSFDGSGNFSISINPSAPQTFYIISVP